MKYQIDQLFQKIKERFTPSLISPYAGGETQENKKLMLDTTICPYCASKNIVKRGWRTKTLEKVQLLLCNDCKKTFTPHHTAKGKHYPLETIFDAISLYNLGYSLEESCRKVNKKPTSHVIARRNEVTTKQSDEIAAVSANWRIPRNDILISPSTLSNWLEEFKPHLPFLRMREFAMAKFKPEDMVITASLAHRQLYRFRFHRAKANITMQENFHHRSFMPLIEFLQMVPGECPHQYFNQGERASETPLTFSKTAMIVRGKANFATQTASFVLQGAKERKNRHEILQKFMLYNDSVTVATEVPVYLTRDDIEHMRTQLGFEIFSHVIASDSMSLRATEGSAAISSKGIASSQASRNDKGDCRASLAMTQLPKLITGHIDFLQIRNGQIHILDFKPNAEKERPIEQLTLYAMALSRLTGLRLFEFKCAWFDEKDYFEFFPLHVLHKPKKAVRRRKVDTMEGIYQVNKNVSKIERIRPL